MSYQIIGQGDPPPPNPYGDPPVLEGYPDNDHIQQAQEKIKKLIDRQHADLKGKFDQIRYSLSQKESKVHQELDEILSKRVNELEECARNINSLNDTYRLNQQKLGTKTLGDVNLKILTTISESIESFRMRINKELNIRILWGSQNIEQSIQNICTISYPTEGAVGYSPPAPNPQRMFVPPSNPGLCKCLHCDAVFSSPEMLTNHLCPERGDPGREGHAAPLLVPVIKEPVPVQTVDTSSDPPSLFYCDHCKQYFSSSDIESHRRQIQEDQKRQIQTISSAYVHSPIPPRQIVDLPPPRGIRLPQPGGQQQLSSAVAGFFPISQVNPPAPPHYHQPAPVYRAPAPNQDLFSPLDQQQQASHAFSKPAEPSHLFMNQVVAPTYPYAASATPATPNTTSAQYKHHPSVQTRRYGMEPIRKYERRLIWRKQVGTISDCVFYFDNFDGGFELMWDRRQESFWADVELEEGEHYGQLSIGDSAVIYPVKKFTIENRPESTQLEIIQLDIHMNTEY